MPGISIGVFNDVKMTVEAVRRYLAESRDKKVSGLSPGAIVGQLVGDGNSVRLSRLAIADGWHEWLTLSYVGDGKSGGSNISVCDEEGGKARILHPYRVKKHDIVAARLLGEGERLEAQLKGNEEQHITLFDIPAEASDIVSLILSFIGDDPMNGVSSVNISREPEYRQTTLGAIDKILAQGSICAVSPTSQLVKIAYLSLLEE